MEGADLDDLINLEGTVRGTIFSGSDLGHLCKSCITRVFQNMYSSPVYNAGCLKKLTLVQPLHGVLEYVKKS